ncbi:hypothetical protein ACFPM7_03765 [Actinokineospora guangxiensis]|uniref:Uncharacterized protein n=1 Tax=Actinokineospora guangxiensis TaxID=1490288 RepID=A0ABW0EIY7_9PSEU
MTRGHDSGRHRRGGSPLGWTPRASRRERSAHAVAEAETEVIPVVDEFPDSPAAGLAKFNLGSIPASVSPPRSWRRAAWFSVAASALVLIGLVFAAATLVTAPRKPDIVDALPGMPTAPNLVVAPTEEPVREPLPSGGAATTTTPTPAPVPTTTTPPEPGRPERPEPVPPPPGEAGPPAPPRPPAPSAAPQKPPRTTISTPMLVPPPATDATLMGDRTEEYYAQVAANPDAAHELTTGPLRREGPESIERRYAGVEEVEVTAMTIDPGRGTTRSQLRVVREDGSVSTVERELTFTYGDNPMISGDTAAS